MSVSSRVRAALMLVLMTVAGSPAATISWSAGNGSWSVNTNWSPQFVPGNGDTVNFFSTAPGGTTIFYDFVPGFLQLPPTLESLNIGLTGGNPGSANTLLLNTGSTLQAATENIGT